MSKSEAGVVGNDYWSCGSY